MACLHTMTSQQLCDLTQKAFNEHKASSSSKRKRGFQDTRRSTILKIPSWHNKAHSVTIMQGLLIKRYGTFQSAENRTVTMISDPGTRPTTGRHMHVYMCCSPSTFFQTLPSHKHVLFTNSLHEVLPDSTEK